jgi:hypothetical protein
MKEAGSDPGLFVLSAARAQFTKIRMMMISQIGMPRSQRPIPLNIARLL